MRARNARTVRRTAASENSDGLSAAAEHASPRSMEEKSASTNEALPFGFDPVSRALRSNPWEIYDRMRAADPVHHSPLGVWVLTRYDDVAAHLRDPRFVMGDFWKRQEAMLGPG